MAQLVKLRDYVSRYENNIYRYPTQFIRLKQENWKKMKRSWDEASEAAKTPESSEKPAWRFLKWFRFNKRKAPRDDANDGASNLPQTQLELKHAFLDKMVSFQLKWATSTVSDVSFVDPSIYKDHDLFYFLQRLPDTYLIFYYPIFHLKQAPVDTDIILVSPLDIEIVHIIDQHHTATIKAKEGRSWAIEANGSHSTLLNPEYALKRTESIVRSVLTEYDVEMPIKRTILSRHHSIVADHSLYQTAIIDRNHHKEWLQERKNLVSPLKNIQLKASRLLLKHCMTSSIKRPEWEEDGPEFTMGKNDE